MAVDLKSTLGRLLRMRTQLLLDEPFFGALALRLKLVEDRTCDTMWVDGVHMGYNPKAVARWTDEELKAVICHEVLHVANGHCWRRGDRDGEDWNHAGDYAINPIVVDGGFRLPAGALLNPDFRGQCAEQIYDTIHRPKMDSSGDPNANQDDDENSDDQNQAPDAQGDEKDDENSDETQDQKSGSGEENDEDQDDDGDGSKDGDGDGNSNGKSDDADDAKDEGSGGGDGEGEGQPDDADDAADGSGAGNGKSDDADDATDGGGAGGSGGEDEDDKGTPNRPQVAGEVRDAPKDVNPKELENDWRVAIDQAAKAAAMRGTMPGNLKRLVEEVLKPSVDWRDVMRQFIQQSWAASDYSWRKPNVRYLSQEVYLPHLASETIPCVIFAIDTSASIWGRLLAQFEAEVRAVVDEHKPEEAFLVYADAAVAKVDRFEAGEPIVFDAAGGGGTDFRPVFDWAEKQGLAPTCVVYLTDLDGVFPAQQPDFPVLWVHPKTPCKAPWGDCVEMRI